MYISAIRKDNLNPSFKSGKTTFFTDFDGTYMPFSHNDICNNCDSFIKTEEFNSMHSKFKDFFSMFNDKLKLVVTTGRSKNEYDYFIKNLNQKNLDIQKPKELITRDGINKYFYENNIYKSDGSRNEKIRSASNITNINRIKKDIEKTIMSIYPEALIVEAPINKNRYEYGEKSLESVLDSNNTQRKNDYISFSQTEELLLELAISPKYSLNKIKNEIEKHLQKNEIRAVVKSYENDKFNYLPVYNNDEKTYQPANIIIIKPIVENKTVSKLFDVKNEVRENIENETNDFVIAAGDGVNDEQMLNPLNYLDLYGIKIDKSRNIEEILSDEKVLESLKKLPFCAIVCSKSESLEHIRKMGELLDKKGIHKVLTTDNPRDYLLKNVKQAIKNYGDTNEEYFYSLGSEFYSNLFNN